MIETGYTKLFSSIVTSTIWREDDKTRIVWITLLALKNRHGDVSGSIPGLAAMANVSQKDCESAIKKLISPDPYSRTKEFDGRRIEAIDGGWHILNAAKYRDAMSDDERRAYKAQWMRQKRAKQKNVDNSVDKSVSLSTHADADADADVQVLHQKVHQPPSVLPKKGVCVSNILEEKKAFEVDRRFIALKGWIEPFFKRPSAHITDAEETRLMAEVSRRPDLKEEINLVEGLFRGLEDKSKFPRSVLRLLQCWQQKVDESRTCKSPVAAQEDRELKEILKPI